MLAGLLRISAAPAETADRYVVSEPEVFENLAIYFVAGKSHSGKMPISLQEGLALRTLQIRETRTVNELNVENTGPTPVFIQAGEIAKGGDQDRVFDASVVVPPHSGQRKVSVYCVESGRWSARDSEDREKFSAASMLLPSRQTRLRMAMARQTNGSRDGESALSFAASPPRLAQQEVWSGVAALQSELSRSVGKTVASPRSETSLQLSLEDGDLNSEIDRYSVALQASGNLNSAIVGFAFAINGELSSAHIYPANELFRKMWPKLLRASATEAIANRTTEMPKPPAASKVSDFLVVPAETDQGTPAKAGERRSENVLFEETKVGSGRDTKWIYRSYIAK
jgi:hypothetical protein